MAWDSGVNAPSGMSYAAPLLSFAELGNLGNDYYQGQKNQFDEQQRQRDLMLQQPINAANSQDAMKELMRRGGGPYALPLMEFMLLAQKQQQAQNLSPLAGGDQQPNFGVGGGTQTMQPSPQATRATYPGGDAGTGTITSLVTAKLPQEDMQTGEAIRKVSLKMGVDPNAPLSPGQITRAKVLVDRATQPQQPPQAEQPQTQQRPQQVASLQSQGGITPNARVAGDFAALPPSAGAVQPAPQRQQPQQQQPTPSPSPPAPSGPLVPQYPLGNDPRTRKPFGSAQAAILAYDNEIARRASQGASPGEIKALEDKRDRFAAMIEPQKATPMTTLLDPRTGRPIYQGAGAAAYGTASESGATLDADAAQYRQTGKFPPNMGRGIQGQQQATAIRNRAVEQEINEGGDPNQWAHRWQQFATQAPALRQLQTRAEALTLAENESKRLIPRVRDISNKISRTEYPTLNSLILAAEKGTGGTDVIRLGGAVAALIPVYARVLKPVGQVTVDDTHRAADILEKQWSSGQINAALDQMEIEIDSAKEGLLDTYKEYGMEPPPGMKRRPDSGGSSASSSGKLQKWERGPDGTLRPAQ